MLEELEYKYSQCRKDLDMANGKIKHFLRNDEEAREAIEEYEAQINDLKNQLHDRDEEINDLQASSPSKILSNKVDSSSNCGSESENNLEIKEPQMLHRMSNLVIKGAQENEKLQSSLNFSKRDMDEANNQQNKFKARLKELETEVEGYKEAFETIEKELQSKEKEFRVATYKVKSTNEKLAIAIEDRDYLEQEIIKYKKEYMKVLDMVKEQDKYSKIQESMKQGMLLNPTTTMPRTGTLG